MMDIQARNRPAVLPTTHKALTPQVGAMALVATAHTNK
jgi:hypothetical protein